MTDLRLALIGSGPQADGYAAVAPRLVGARLTAALERGEQLDPALADAAIVCLPGDASAAACHRLGSAGVHLLLDGPLNSPGPLASKSEFQRLVDACQATGARLMPACHTWFRPAFQAILDSLRAGKLGLPGLLRMHGWRSADGSTCPFGPPALTPDVCLAEAVFGASAELAHGRLAGDPSGSRAAVLHLGFANGGMALLEAAEVDDPSTAYETLSIIGATGAAYSDDHHNMQLAFADGAPHALRTSDAAAGLLDETQEFVNAIRDNREPCVTTAQWSGALNTLAMAGDPWSTAGSGQ